MADTLSIKDSRTGKQYEIPISDGAIRASDLRQIKVSDTDFGLMSYDPSFMNTASCKSKITFIDGDKGILRYRGYPIEDLAEKHSYLEVAYLLIYGELPSKAELDSWVHNITYHTMVHENVKKFMDGFHYDAHPMGMLVSTIAALSTFYPNAKQIFDAESRKLQIYRLIGKIPTLAAFAYRHSQGMAYIYPSNDLSYAENFLSMMYRPSWTTQYQPNEVLAKALDTLFILHADHEQNCSSTAMRVVGSSHPDPYTAAAAATAALYGPLHGGANEEVVRMLVEIGSKDKIPETIAQVKEGKRLLMGFGHRVYKNYDPRAKIIKKLADEVFAVTGRNPLLDIALELERVALSDDYFVKRKLYPNVDFYSGLIYQAMGFPTDIFPVLFAIPRMSGWLAQWQEMLLDSEQKISRPRQLYTGYGERRIQRE
ncbi:MAG: citrate synthase [Nitrososphaerota archaeon]|nr:citrate synthase [Nitrososphaerota archaeon]